MDNLKKTKSNDELRSRRQFFKRTAKGILPILGMIVLAGTPLLTQAGENCMCAGNCSGGCQGDCNYTCRGGCKTGCEVNCAKTCNSGCKTTCEGTATNYWK